MPQLRELNDKVGLSQQLQSNEDGSIVLINVFTVDPEDEEALLASWAHDAEFMKAAARLRIDAITQSRR